MTMEMTSRPCRHWLLGDHLSCKSISRFEKLIPDNNSIFRNPIVPCESISIPRVDLAAWKENVQDTLFHEDISPNSLSAFPSQAVNAASGGLLQSEGLSQTPFSAFDVNTIFDGQTPEKRTRKNIYNLDVKYYG